MHPHPDYHRPPNPRGLGFTWPVILGTVGLTAVAATGLIMGYREMGRHFDRENRRAEIWQEAPPLSGPQRQSGSGYPGMTREQMQEIQVTLNELNYPVKVDGLWVPGGDTWAMIVVFQKDYGLTPDGKPGPNTRGVLERIASEGYQEPPPSEPPSEPPAPTPGGEPLPSYEWACQIETLDDHPRGFGVAHGITRSRPLAEAVVMGREVTIVMRTGLRVTDITVEHRHNVHVPLSAIQALRAGEEVRLESSGPSDRFDSHIHDVRVSCTKTPT